MLYRYFISDDFFFSRGGRGGGYMGQNQSNQYGASQAQQVRLTSHRTTSIPSPKVEIRVPELQEMFKNFISKNARY